MAEASTASGSVAGLRQMPSRAHHWSACMAVPFGVLGIRCSDAALTELWYLDAGHPLAAPDSATAQRVVREIERYLDDPSHRFEIALAPAGTPFQQRVWQGILDIPAGETRSYGELARATGSVARAVGQACGSNPIALFIPCHRVTGSRGELTGFMHSTADDPLAIKRWLLAHERGPFGLTPG